MNDIAVRGSKILRYARKTPHYKQIRDCLCYTTSIVDPCSLFTGYFIVDELLFVAAGKECFDTLLGILNRIGVL